MQVHNVFCLQIVILDGAAITVTNKQIVKMRLHFATVKN